MSEQKQSSETALGTAFIRALSCFEPDPEIKGCDDLAVLFMPETVKKKLQSERYREAARSKIGSTYEYIIARTKYFDGVFQDALSTNIGQIVILGAGYDSRAYRFRSEMNETVVFEVDAPYTQAAKIEKLEMNGIPHENVRFVAVDFEKDDLETQLCANGYQNTKTLFIWEGVSLYLTPESVDSTLDHLGSLCCSGSLLCFDYFNSRIDSRKIRKKDEMILFGLSSTEMNEYLGSKGFSVLREIEPDELQRCFLTCSDGSLFGGLNKKTNLIKSVYEPASAKQL